MGNDEYLTMTTAIGKHGESAGDVRVIVDIPIELLEVGVENVRKSLEDEETSVSDLARDIQQHGLLHPITVRHTENGTYTIVAGQRRYLALRSLGRQTVPCRVVVLTDSAAEEISLTENVQRAQLITSDKVRTFSRLYELYNHDITKLSNVVSVSEATLRKYLKIATLPTETLNRLDGKGDGKLTLDTAIELTKLPPDIVEAAADAVARLSTNAQRAEAVKQLKADPTANIAAVVDQVSAAALVTMRLVDVPTKPWIIGRDGSPMIISEHMYEPILALLEASTGGLISHKPKKIRG